MTDLTKRQAEVVRAVLDHDGNYTAAAWALGVTEAAVQQIMKAAGLRLGVTRRSRSRNGGRDYVAAVARAARLVSEPVAPLRPARACGHLDREELSLGLCKECYAERMARSREVPLKPPLTREQQRVRDRIDAELAGGVLVAEERDVVPKTGGLTRAEILALAATAEGDSIEEAAADLGVARQTIKNQLASAYKKLGTRKLVEALIVLGWLRVPSAAELDEMIS